MDLIQCQCGQRFSPVDAGGERRTVCPVCRRSVHGNTTTEPTSRSKINQAQAVSGWIMCLGIASLVFAMVAGVVPVLMLVFGGLAIVVTGESMDAQTAIALAAAISALLGAVLHFAGGIGLLIRRFWAWHAMLLSAIFLVPAALFFTFTFAQRPPESATSVWIENLHYASLGVAIWPVAFFLILYLTPIRARVRSFR